MYKNVVDDVIRGVREEFLNEAVDLEVLEDLKRVSFKFRAMPCCTVVMGDVWVGEL